MNATSLIKRISPEQRVFAGTGCLDLLAAELERVRSARALIVCGKSIANDGAVNELLRKACDGRLVGMFSQVSPHSTVASVERASRSIKDHRADSVIAVGGGSAIVTARAASILAAEAGPDRPVQSLATARGGDGRLTSPRLLAPKLPQIVIPTTPTTAIAKAGSALSDEAAKRRLALFDPKTRARAIFLDPRLLRTAPGPLVLTAALNTLSMAVEGLATGQADPVATAMLSSALRTCVLGLGEADALETQSTRLDLAWAAIMCGLGTDSAGGGLTSALGHAAGIVAGTTSGLVNAIVLPEALRFNRVALASAIPEIAHALGVAGGDPGEEFARILHVVESVLGRLPIPSRLRDLPLPYDMLPRISQEAMDDWSLATNPRQVAGPAELQAVLEAVW